MIESIVITQTGAVNKPWYALITKLVPPYPSAMVAKFENYVFVLDPSAMDRRSIWIRSFERYYSKETMANDGFYAQVGSLIAIPHTSSLFKVMKNRIIYPAELAELLPRFPVDDAGYFVHAAINRTHDQIYGTSKERTDREKKMAKEMDELRLSKKKKKKKKPVEIIY